MYNVERPLLLRADDAAALLGLRKSKVYALMRSGELPSVRIGTKAVRVPREELDAWVREKVARTR
jgi:excisionase family DNA binding protein